MMRKLLISGFSGFVGSNMGPYLQKNNFEVIGISRQQVPQGLTYENIGLSDWNDCYAFIHLAGKAHDIKNVSHPNTYFEANRDLTISLFDDFLNSTAQLFIYFSSVKSAADTIEKPLQEGIVPNPISIYGKSKLEAENYILSQDIPPNKKVYVLRPCMIHGPNNKGNLNLLYKLISKGIPYPLGKYHNKRYFLSIDNLNFVVLELLNQKPESGIYNLSDDQSLSTIELVKIISDSLDKKAKIWKVPKSIINVIASIGTFFKLPFSNSSVKKLTENYEVDNTKIKSTLKIELPISAEEGLLRTLKSFHVC